MDYSSHWRTPRRAEHAVEERRVAAASGEGTGEVLVRWRDYGWIELLRA